MKRIFALLLSITLLFSAVVTPVSAESINNFTVKVSDATATAGDSQVAVDIMLEDNPGIAGFSFCVNYDTEKLVLVESKINIEDGYKVVAQPTGYGVNLAWTSPSGYSEDGKIATLYFNVPKDLTSSEANIDIVYRDGYDSFYDSHEHDIVVQSVSGTVTIAALQETNGPSVNIGGVSVNFGATDIVVPITINNNPGFSGFSFCINYDTTRLVLDSTNILIDGGYKVIGHPEGYGVNIAWTSTETYTQDGTIAELHFSLKDNANSGKAYINVVFREGYDSFYSFDNGYEQDIIFDSFNGYIDVNNHNFGEWVITTPATCTSTGLKTRTCLDCSKTETAVILKVPHEYETVITPPTCIAQGYTTHTCKTCSDYYVDSYTDMVDHTPGNWEQSIAPECAVKGEEIQKCSVCKTTINTRPVDETGHSFDNWYVVSIAKFNEDGQERRDCKNCNHFETKRIPKLSEGHVCDFTGAEEIIEDATCTANGSKKIYCSETECGNFEIVQIIAAGHKFGDWYTTIEPKFDEDGEQRRDCNNCDYYETNRLPKLSESHVCSYTGSEEIVEEATCTQSGSKKVYCSHPSCNKFTTVSVDPTGHTSGTWEVEKSATCTETGTEVIKCTTCKTVLQSRSFDATGHSWDNGVITKKADCLNEGEKTFTCSTCSAKDVKTIPAGGHTEGEWQVVNPANCTETGRKELHCTVCQQLLAIDAIAATGHQYGSWIVTTQPTATTAGEKSRECSVCHDIQTSAIDPTGNLPKIVVSSTKGSVGSTVKVTISLQDNPGIITANLKVGYDGTKLQLVSAEDTGLLNDSIFSNDLTLNPYVLCWDDALALSNNSSNGAIVTLTFKVLQSDACKTDIVVTFEENEIYDMNLDPVFFETQNGQVEIVDFIFGDVDGDGVCNIRDATILRRYVAKWEGVTVNELAADVNNDGVVNIRDATILRRHVAKWGGYEELPYV
ncbi:MAG: hypothetical protein IKB36_03515 [Clostridia bacterium]|nr:hypothetical protein [Clostridia bacterium]